MTTAGRDVEWPKSLEIDIDHVLQDKSWHLVSLIWDFAGSSNDGSDDDISLMVVQPFVN